MRRMKKRGPNVLYDLNDLLFFLTICAISHKELQWCGLKTISRPKMRPNLFWSIADLGVVATRNSQIGWVIHTTDILNDIVNLPLSNLVV